MDQVERTRRMEKDSLPADLDYAAVKGLRREAADRLSHHRPATLGQASRIAGVTPADISVIQIHLANLQDI